MAEVRGPATPPQRAPRRDAVRNEMRVLAAARAVFAEHGPEASMGAIAARAGVGVGTVYRRFDGKDALLDAIAELLATEMDQAAADALADEDVERGLQSFLEYVGVFTAEKHRYTSELLDRVGEHRTRVATEQKVQQLTENAVQAGVLAPDIRAEDLKALMVALRGVVALGDDDSWRRFLRIHLLGLTAR